MKFNIKYSQAMMWWYWELESAIGAICRSPTQYATEGQCRTSIAAFKSKANGIRFAKVVKVSEQAN